MLKVPLLDLKAQYQSIKNEVDQAVEEVLAEQQFILGPKVQECEDAIAVYSQSRFACGVSSGTDALLISLLNEEIGAGDEVITSAYSFFATAGSIARVGAKPVFVDIDPVTYNLDPEQLEENITSKTKAIIPVHLFGQMAEMGAIQKITQAHGLIVIEDAAQALGAEDGARRAGSIGHYGCLSFFPAKNLGGFGDGGMVLTNDEKRHERLKALRMHGARTKYNHDWLGGNFRLDALQAAIIRVKLKYLDLWIAKRNENAQTYNRLFEAAGLIGAAVTLPARVRDRHTFHQYVIRAINRNALARFLNEKGVGCEIYYPCPLPYQKCFSHLGHKKGAFPESEKAAEETLALPTYPELSEEQMEYVVKTIAEFYQSCAA
ncbi:MAG: transcriptional regulator [Omnitrophica bacterium RIFCSPLOWO2_12_FULL_50_11]|nr:MAG: transcriptional regulator [Omnitrophica bacterium RIFCSPLOWO2_12_FULL_50_11]